MSINEPPNMEQSSLRLPTLSMTPSVEKLKEALRLANNNAQNIIELPWKSTNSPVNYIIKVTCSINPQEPSWILNVGGEGIDSVVWNYNTPDCQMIHGLITAEVDRAVYAAPPATAQDVSAVSPQQLSPGSIQGAAPLLPGLQFQLSQQSQSQPVAALPTVQPQQAVVQNQQPPHLAPQPQTPAPKAKPELDWGASQSTAQQGQGWNWALPVAPAANANWSTSSHLPLSHPPEPIVPINDHAAFSQSWGAPSPSISSAGSGNGGESNVQSPAPATPAPASSIYLSGPLANNHNSAARNAASQTLGLPQMQPPESLQPVPIEPPVMPAPALPPAQPVEAPVSAPTVVTARLAAPATAVGAADSFFDLVSAVIPEVSPAPPEVAMPGTSFIEAAPEVAPFQVSADAQSSPVDEATVTLDSVPVEQSAPVESLTLAPQPVSASSRGFETQTNSATLPLGVQETIPSDKLMYAEQNDQSAFALDQNDLAPELPSPVVPTSGLSSADFIAPSTVEAPPSFNATPATADVQTESVAEVPVEVSPQISPWAGPPGLDSAESSAKQASRRKGRSSKINMAAMNLFGPDPTFEQAPPAVADSPVNSVEVPIAPEAPLDSSVESLAEAFAGAALAEEITPSVQLTPEVHVEPSFEPAFSSVVDKPADITEQLLESVSPAPIELAAPAGFPTASSSAVESMVSPAVAERPVESAVEPVVEPAIEPVAETAVESAEVAPVVNDVEPRKHPLPPPAPFNREAVDVIFKGLTNEETGFMTNSAFMFFIVREFSVFQKAQIPMSLIGFELALRAPDGAMYPLHLAALRECGRRFFSVMRPLDWLAHYSDDEYALLLPHTNIRDAILLVKQLYTVLNQGPLLPGMEDAQVVMHCGIASIPEDCQHPGILIAAAYEAKNEAKSTNLALQLFRDMPV